MVPGTTRPPTSTLTTYKDRTIPLSGQAQAFFVVFTSFALAALQNVTVDDAVLTGAVVPQYLPSGSVWNTGNECTRCFVKPNPSLAYNGTWHDTTYRPGNGYTQAIEFTFTGSALYIFFIIANNVTGATTFTNVEFVLDQDPVRSYIHTPLSSTDYQYNVPVYANDSLASGEHNMMIQPVNSGNDLLILFDYLIYTMDTPSSVSPSASATATLSPSPSIGAIVGGTVGGVTAFVLLAASLICYRRHRGRNDGRPSVEKGTVVDPFILSREADPTPLGSTTVSTHPMGLPITQPTSRSKTTVSSVTVRPSNPPGSTTASSSGAASSGNNSALLEQVGQLRDEVARLRHLQDSNRNSIELPTEAPPEYSEGQAQP